MGFHTCWHKDETGFTSFFSRASFGYGCVVWDPFTKKDLIRFKIIQNLALRFGFRLKGWVSFFFEPRENFGLDAENSEQVFMLKLMNEALPSLDFYKLINIVIPDKMLDCMFPQYGRIPASILFGSEPIELCEAVL